METNQIAAIDPQAAGDTCERCHATLSGSLVVTSQITEHAGIIAFVENSPRNWILCDSCSALLCRDCAPHFKTGYCEDCIREHDLKFDSEGRLL